MPSVNWEAEVTGLPLVGKYVFEIRKVTEKYGKNSGDPYFAVEFVMVKRPDVVLEDVLSFSDKALPISKRKLKALGFAGKSDIDPDDLVGKRVGIAVKHEENFFGETELRVDIAASGSTAGYYELAVAGGAPKPIEKPKPPVDADFDDDIPF